MRLERWPIDTSFTLILKKLRDEQGQIITNAVVSGRLYDEEDNVVHGPVSFPHASGGDYAGSFPPLSLHAGRLYEAVVTATFSGKTHTSRARRTAKFLRL